jgi:alpha-1,3/alpha-1,6-mannosyltransferase
VAGLLKRAYRLPFDWFEGWSMSGSDRIVVNSNFTKSVAVRTFPSLGNSFGVIYPCVKVPAEVSGGPEERLWNDKLKILLSINRFERKKDIGLAIKAYKGFPPSERKDTRLILAGGYDNRVPENVQYHNELVQMAEDMGLVTATAKTVPTALGVPDTVEVLFLLSVPEAFKTILLENARLLLYTPSNEHFGIVPVEAMQHGVPVLASNTGGPLETIAEGKTGWLCDVSRVDKWTAVIRKVIIDLDDAERARIKTAGRTRVKDSFSREIMAQKFDWEIQSMTNGTRSTFTSSREIFMAIGVVAVFVTALIAALVRPYVGRPGDKRLSEFARARRAHQEPTDDADPKFGTFNLL